VKNLLHIFYVLDMAVNRGLNRTIAMNLLTKSNQVHMIYCFLRCLILSTH